MVEERCNLTKPSKSIARAKLACNFEEFLGSGAKLQRSGEKEIKQGLVYIILEIGLAQQGKKNVLSQAAYLFTLSNYQSKYAKDNRK